VQQVGLRHDTDHAAKPVHHRAYLPTIPLWLRDVPATEVPTPDQDADERARLEELLAPWLAKYPEVPVETRVSHDSAAAVLVGVSHGARLVIVGSHNHGVVASAFLGSTDMQLLHHADCPVYITRPHFDQEQAR
jgi:nucleotide-binding universal stress UspA family protein